MDKKIAFIELINRNQGLIYKVASLYTNTIEDRNDLTQEIIYQLWKSFDTFKEKASISTWMYRVAMNIAINHLKISQRKILTSPINEQALNFTDVGSTDIEEKLSVIKQHIENLNLLDKGIILLYLESKSYDEIAQIVGISTSNVGTRISRIKERLKQKIYKK